MHITGKTFIVTGGASGLGEAVAKQLIHAGCNVVIFDIQEANLQRLCQQPCQGQALVPGAVDVRDEDQVAQGIQQAKVRFGALAGAIICHGIVHGPPDIQGYGPDDLLCSFKQFEYVIKVNLFGTYNVAQQVANTLVMQEPLDIDGERGVIIMVSSIAGIDGAVLPYGTSKAAIAGLTLPFARELAGFGIRVMTVAPGVFDTPMTRGMPPGYNAVAEKLQQFPKRSGQPSEFAGLVQTILENAMLNGSVIRLDGAMRL
ncbi:hypothetical protein NQZ79_g7582 [Umbelopsis isabellina]|nr:hypothetical protein NQZ79_g7582 [Umbelopsis isabellina]